jgi:2-desacetyl-2-hydroxyethyl bacteriochlorophyllide A dehydrogenase
MSDDSRINARVSLLQAPRKLVLKQEVVDTASLGATELAIATEFSAISPGTELAAYAGLPPLRPGNPYPRLVGYCNCGRVIAAGAAVEKFRVGDRVLTFASHRSHYRIDAKEVVATIPPDLDGALASVTYLFHLSYAALQRARVTRGQRLAVIGLGVLGMTTAATAHLEGLHVIALSKREAALKQAHKFGADETMALTRTGVRELADVVVTTSNDWNDWLVALQAARRGGTIAVLGFPGREQPQAAFNPLDSQYFYDKQLSVFAAGQLVEGSPEIETSKLQQNMAFLVDQIARKRLPAGELARHVKPADQLVAAYEELLARRGDVLTYILQW